MEIILTGNFNLEYGTWQEISGDLSTKEKTSATASSVQMYIKESTFYIRVDKWITPNIYISYTCRVLPGFQYIKWKNVSFILAFQMGYFHFSFIIKTVNICFPHSSIQNFQKVTLMLVVVVFTLSVGLLLFLPFNQCLRMFFWVKLQLFCSFWKGAHSLFTVLFKPCI